MATLYEIVGDMHDLLTEVYDEIPPDIETRLEALEIAFPVKVESILKFHRDLMFDIEKLKSERERLKAREESIERHATWLKSYLMRCMNVNGHRKVQTLTDTVSIVKSPLKVEMEAGTTIPAKYCREKTVYELDKASILADFKAGKPLPINISVVQNEHLKIS